MENIIEKFISFIISPVFPNSLKPFQWFFMLLSVGLLVFIIYALMKTTWFYRLIIWDLQEFLTYRPFGVRKIVKDWQKIKFYLEGGQEVEYKLAVIKADEMLNKTLAKMGFGEMDVKAMSLGERLAKLSDFSISNLEETKEVHKIFNNVIHDPDYRLSLEEAKKVITAYEKALHDLEAL